MPTRAPLYTEHPRALTVLFDDLQNGLATWPTVFAGTPGSVLVKTNERGFRFYTRQFYDGTGRRRDEYLGGPVGDAEVETRAADVRERILETKGRIGTIRLLAKAGYQAADARTFATAAILHNHGIFQAGGTLIGSHAFGVLLNGLGIRAPGYATEDVDLARREALALPPDPGRRLLDILAETGIAFVEVPSLGRRTPSTSWKEAGRSAFHVDLLVPSRNGSVGVVEVPELGAHATALPWLGYLLHDHQDAALLSREGGCLVRVPSPERFAVHKLIVSQLRTSRTAKSDRDIAQAAALLAILGDRHPGAIEDAVAAVPAGARRHLVRALRAVEPLLNEAHPRAWEALKTAAGARRSPGAGRS